MKRISILFFTITCIIGLLTACSSKNNNETIVFSLDANGNYTGFSNLPKHYTVEEAEKDGYFVKQSEEVIANNKVWDNFIETSTRGNNTGIRIVVFDTETNSPYFSDLFFNDDHYYLFDSSSENQEKQPFSYLMTLEGRFGNPIQDGGVIVLTDDNTLTFDVVMKSMISSNMEYKKSVSPYRLVMFQ